MLYLLCKNKEGVSLNLFLLGIPSCQCHKSFSRGRSSHLLPGEASPAVTWLARERDRRFTTQMQTLFNTLMSLSSPDLCPLCLRCVWNALSPLVLLALYMVLSILQCLQGYGWQDSIFLITPTLFHLNCSVSFSFH